MGAVALQIAERPVVGRVSRLVVRDTARLVRLLDDLPRRPDVQMIVAATAVECSELQEGAAGWSDVLVASGRIGRGAQRNAGARMASGDVLLFLHVNSELWKGARVLLRDLR